ncbi:MAG: class I SAM-dependent methyltransferase [Candidatus Heimdallarchaeota archaeon]
MAEEMRGIVEKGYDEGNYQKFYRQSLVLNPREKRFFAKLLDYLPTSARILDLGSGIGIPYDRYLVKRGFAVTGIDVSSNHIAKARKYVPEAEYIKADFSRTDLGQSSFHAIISIYSVFHIPRKDHASLFVKINSALKDGGILLVTMGTNDVELDIDEFVGSRMAWSSFSIPENVELIKQARFKLLHVEEQDEDPQEHHLWILAQKILE